MRTIRFALSALCMWLAVGFWPTDREALAQEGKGLSDVLTDLLRGTDGEIPTPGPDRRIPFSEEEVQLSFVPRA